MSVHRVVPVYFTNMKTSCRENKAQTSVLNVFLGREVAAIANLLFTELITILMNFYKHSSLAAPNI